MRLSHTKVRGAIKKSSVQSNRCGVDSTATIAISPKRTCCVACLERERLARIVLALAVVGEGFPITLIHISSRSDLVRDFLRVE